MRSALRRAATDVDGINSAKVKLGRRTARVTASSRASQAGLAQDLNTEVGTAVADRLAALQLRHAPRAPGGAGKTCPAGYTSATINGATKCLAAGQQCSSKAINSYPQYGYICASSNGRLTLRRK